MTYYIIRDGMGRITRNPDKTIMMFDYPIQADKKIRKMGNSPYLKVQKWNNKQKPNRA